MTLLNTIKLPKNLKLLSDRLPKSKYDDSNETNSMVNANTESRSLLNEVSSLKSLKTNPDDSNRGEYVIRTGGRKAHPGNKQMRQH